jgi:hypothetical protein
MSPIITINMCQCRTWITTSIILKMQNFSPKFGPSPHSSIRTPPLLFFFSFFFLTWNYVPLCSYSIIVSQILVSFSTRYSVPILLTMSQVLCSLLLLLCSLLARFFFLFFGVLKTNYLLAPPHARKKQTPTHIGPLPRARGSCARGRATNPARGPPPSHAPATSAAITPPPPPPPWTCVHEKK